MVIAGGSYKSSVEVLTGELGTKQLPNLPEEISASSMVLHDGTILLCGGWNNSYNRQWEKCLHPFHE